MSKSTTLEMFTPSITVFNTPQDRTTNIVSSRNKNRNHRPCGNCSDSKVRCNVSHPYTKLLCKRCKKDGLTQCPPYIQRNAGKRRRKRNPVPPVEFTDAMGVVFIHENMFPSNNPQVLQAGSGEIVTMSDNSVNASSQTAIVSSPAQVQYPIGYRNAVRDGHVINNVGSDSGRIATSTAMTGNSFDVLNTDARTNNQIRRENQFERYVYNWLIVFPQGTVDTKLEYDVEWPLTGNTYNVNHNDMSFNASFGVTRSPD
ncbi:hypothetical protein BD410DRAFT_845710 [Rickenella mellea]|uniref:Zn(2)-C6 fungal-type domain-containing protein n=1 Tax=Rickenella mellea TaxID=50990 RepID=A0A4Y7PH78_9AGAM|nr:hypothetical protein BD410DRAFT_845710 [Rickenella mellea]